MHTFLAIFASKMMEWVFIIDYDHRIAAASLLGVVLGPATKELGNSARALAYQKPN